MHGGPLTAAAGLATASVGMITSVVGWTFAASTEIAPWAQVGGTATAVGALAYVAKMLADGKLVAQPVADLIRDQKNREDKLVELVEASKEREDALRAFLVGRGAR